MMTVCLAHHLGLPQAIASVVQKVAKCPKCITFWSVLLVLQMLGYSLILALMLSIVMSYISHYFGLLLMGLNRIYEWIWQRLNK